MQIKQGIFKFGVPITLTNGFCFTKIGTANALTQTKSYSIMPKPLLVILVHAGMKVLAWAMKQNGQHWLIGQCSKRNDVLITRQLLMTTLATPTMPAVDFLICLSAGTPNGIKKKTTFKRHSW